METRLLHALFCDGRIPLAKYYRLPPELKAMLTTAAINSIHEKRSKPHHQTLYPILHRKMSVIARQQFINRPMPVRVSEYPMRNTIKPVNFVLGSSRCSTVAGNIAADGHILYHTVHITVSAT